MINAIIWPESQMTCPYRFQYSLTTRTNTTIRIGLKNAATQGNGDRLGLSYLSKIIDKIRSTELAKVMKI